MMTLLLLALLLLTESMCSVELLNKWNTTKSSSKGEGFTEHKGDTDVGIPILSM